jgi:sarcosine oxidase
MGSAALLHLARRGARVLGLERYDVPNTQGSSHGATRIIRLAYFEEPAYVPLLRRAYELWDDLQRAQGETLLVQNGCLDIGPPDGHVIAGADRAAHEHGVPVERLDAGDIARRFPGFRVPAGYVGLLDPAGGFLLPERCVVAHAEQAQAAGAVIRAREGVLAWESRADGIHVRTERGTVVAQRLVLAAGAWMEKLGAAPPGLLVPERQALAWFQPRRPELFSPAACPVWIVDAPTGQFYGFPVHGIPGFKLGRMNHLGETVDPDAFDREPGPSDEALLRAFADEWFPEAAGPTMSLATCLFTNTPDAHFVLDLLPQDERVVVVSPCSGHGFKFSSVVGEIAADLALEGATRHDIGFLRLARFAGTAGGPGA